MARKSEVEKQSALWQVKYSMGKIANKFLTSIVWRIIKKKG